MSKNINVSLPMEERLGQVGINNQGEKITIVAYRNSIDMDVQFEDGVIVQNKRYGNFLKGKVAHPIRYEESFAYHIEVELGLDINKIWNWKKNTVNPYEITKCSNKKVWLYCQEKDYHNDDGGYEIQCNSFHNGNRCSYCGNMKTHSKDSFAQWGIDNFGEDFLEKYWSKKNIINPYTIAPQSSKKVWLYCQEKDYHNDDGGYEMTCSNFYNNQRCSYCHNGDSKVHIQDSVAYLYPQVAEMIVMDERNKVTMEDLYKVTPCSHNKYYFKCNECKEGTGNKKEIRVVIRYGFLCEYCSDGLSIPEKFMINILKQLNVEFITQLSKSNFKWCQGYRYDFYIPSLNMIIETHGSQHYERGFESCGGRARTLEEEQKNDKEKKELALNNNIKSYIVVNCRCSSFDWLKENIIKELTNYFNLSNIDWNLVWENSLKSLVWEVEKLVKEGKSNEQIANILNINKNTVISYKRQLGVKNASERRKENLLKVKEMVDLGYSNEQMVKELNLNRSTIIDYKKQLGIKTRYEIYQENLLKTKELFQQGKTVKEIAEELKLNISTIYDYKKELNL